MVRGLDIQKNVYKTIQNLSIMFFRLMLIPSLQKEFSKETFWTPSKLIKVKFTKNILTERVISFMRVLKLGKHYN